MIYPYDHKFLIFNDIKSALTGYGRMMFYRTFSKDRHGKPDPTVTDCENENWISLIKEGKFNQGMAEGYQRQLSGFNGICKQGFFLEDEPFGKYVEYDVNGKEWKKEGVYYKTNDCLREEKFESFEENFMASELDDMFIQRNNKLKADQVPTPHLLNQSVNENNVTLISGISNLTNQEA